MDVLVKKQTELMMQQKWNEADKVKKEMDKLIAESDKEGKKFQEIYSRPEKAKREIEDKSRYREIRIIANSDYPGKGTNYKPLGTIKGQTLYRRSGERALGLSVYMGPPGFRNEGVQGKAFQLEIKSILVEITTYTTTENMKSDEAVARQMLERIDYAGLVEMIQK